MVKQRGQAMEIKNYYFMLVLIIALLSGTTESFGYSHTFLNQNNNDKGTLTETNEANQDPIEEYNKVFEALDKKRQQMDKEYRTLTNEKNQLNAESIKFYKKRSNRQRNSRTIKQGKLFDAKRQIFNQKYADYIDRKEKLNTEMKELNEIVIKYNEIQSKSK